MFESLKEIETAHPLWFAPDAMRFFDSRVYLGTYGTPNGAYFVSSEQFDDASPRLYSVRYADVGGIRTVGEFQEYRTLEEAQRVADILAKEAREV